MKKYFFAVVILAVATGVAAEGKCYHTPDRCNDDDVVATVLHVVLASDAAFIGSTTWSRAKAVAVVADELLWHHVEAATGLDPRARAATAELLIDAYLHAGLSGEAIALYESLDADMQRRVVAGPMFSGSASTPHWEQHLSIGVTPNRTAAGLAAAYAEADKSDRADALLDMPRETPDPKTLVTNTDRESATAIACTRALLHGNADTDWFVWRFGDAANARVMNGCTAATDGRAYQRRAARWIAASGLPASWRPWNPPEEPPADETAQSAAKIPEVMKRIAALQALVAADDARDAAWLNPSGNQLADFGTSREHHTPSAADRALAERLKERIAAQLFNPYTIEKVKPSKAVPALNCAPHILACANVAGVLWELFVSKDYDPSGEIPAAGYWLRRTSLPDGEAVAYYLGIKEHLPFEFVGTDEPIIVGDELRLRMQRAEIDPDKITFPPIGLALKGDNSFYELHAKLDDILRDSDHDGLTDLAEQQLLLDPQNPDSDGDGIPDGKDRLPDVADVPPTPRTKAMMSAIAFLTDEPDWGVSIGVPGSSEFVQRRKTDERTLFVVADPADIATSPGASRIVVLPTSLDYSTLREHPGFAMLFATSVSITMLDDRHAEVSFGEGWRGGTLALDFRDGVWRVGNLGGWIT